VPAHGERPVRVTAGELAGSILAGEMVDDDPGTFAQEGLGERAAQAASAPGDEHDLLGERGDGAGGGMGGRWGHGSGGTIEQAGAPAAQRGGAHPAGSR